MTSLPVQVQHGFDLNEHDNLHGLVSHLYKLQMSKGDAKPDEMLRYVRTKSFRRSVSRKGAAQVSFSASGTVLDRFCNTRTATQTDRQLQTTHTRSEREGETDRQRQRQTYTKRQRHTLKDREVDWKTRKDTDTEGEREMTDRDWLKDSQRQTDRDWLKGRQTENDGEKPGKRRRRGVDEGINKWMSESINFYFTRVAADTHGHFTASPQPWEANASKIICTYVYGKEKHNLMHNKYVWQFIRITWKKWQTETLEKDRNIRETGKQRGKEKHHNL